MPLPFERWFQGRYFVVPGIDALEKRPNPRPGEIVRHRGGRVVILRCPACAALQFYAVEMTGPDEAPTFVRPVRCSAGSCRDCGVWFLVVEGAVGPVEPPVERPRKIPTILDGRIKPPPKVE